MIDMKDEFTQVEPPSVLPPGQTDLNTFPIELDRGGNLIMNKKFVSLFKLGDGARTSSFDKQNGQSFTTQFYAVANANGTFSATPTIDWMTGNTQIGAVSANTTFTMVNPMAGALYTLLLLQDESGARTYTFTQTRWPGGSGPAGSAGGKWDIINFFFDGGSYYGSSSLNYS